MLPIPTRRLAVLALVFSVPVLAFGSGWAFLALNLVLVGVMVVDSVLSVPPSTVVVGRTLPEVVGLGDEAEVTWYVANPTSRHVTVWVADELAPSLLAGTRRLRVRIGPRGEVEVGTTMRPTRRGLFEPTRVTVRVEGPLGLGSRQRDRHLPGAVRVYPPFRSRAEAELRIGRARILEVGLRSARGRGGGTEFDQLREYTVDDEFRRMDWAATARAGKPIVRTHRAERNQIVVNLLDNGRVMAGRVDGVPRVEHAMDAVMMLTAVASRLGDRVGLVAFDRAVRAVVAPAVGRGQLGRVTRAMYDLDPVLVEADYRGAFLHTLARFRRRALLVVYTDLVEQAVGESLLPALPLVARSHLVIVAAVQDPEVLAWARSTPSDAADSYRKAAAIASLADRRRAAARLRALGSTVVDVPPGRMAPVLADTYLHLKAVGRL